MTSFTESTTPPPKWKEGDKGNAKPERPNTPVYRPDILEAIETRISELDEELRALSLDIHGLFDV